MTKDPNLKSAERKQTIDGSQCKDKSINTAHFFYHVKSRATR